MTTTTTTATTTMIMMIENNLYFIYEFRVIDLLQCRNVRQGCQRSIVTWFNSNIFILISVVCLVVTLQVSKKASPASGMLAKQSEEIVRSPYFLLYRILPKLE